ncbi:hypothetical protein DFH09DRAFT_1302435 [Mycena vulgaris]|nr:hypothetical protein DFH09DRAFT_1302435 [Mycena vulgaris]
MPPSLASLFDLLVDMRRPTFEEYCMTPYDRTLIETNHRFRVESQVHAQMLGRIITFCRAVAYCQDMYYGPDSP